VVLHGFSPFAPILAAVAAKQNEYTSGACVLLLGSFLRAAGTSEAAIVARVKTREQQFHRANLLPESNSTPAAAAAALGPSTDSVYGLKSVDRDEGLEKGRDMVYALCTVVGGSVAKVGIGPKSRPMKQCNEHNKEHSAEPIRPLCIALFPPELGGKKNGGEDDRVNCNVRTFVKDWFEAATLAMVMGDLPPKAIFGSVASICGGSEFGAAPRSLSVSHPHAQHTPARARAHARTRTHARSVTHAVHTRCLTHTLPHSYARVQAHRCRNSARRSWRSSQCRTSTRPRGRSSRPSSRTCRRR
jgi:hypothetical protein